ncbi:MAG: hypothetical protein MUE40_18025 [Anaerolineae bacterium]|jgi:hypothetical protein|nr:hypothetical protein [Anaerolineae bacterium]
MFNHAIKPGTSTWLFPQTLTGINAALSLYRHTLVIRRKGTISGLRLAHLPDYETREIQMHQVVRADITPGRVLRIALRDQDPVFVVYAHQDDALARQMVRFIRRAIAEKNRMPVRLPQ